MSEDEIKDTRDDLGHLVENFEKCIDLGLHYQEKGQELVNLGKIGKGVAKHFNENYDSYERLAKDFPDTKPNLDFIGNWSSYGNKKLESNIQGLYKAQDLVSEYLTDIGSVCLSGSSGYSGYRSDIDEIRIEHDLVNFNETYHVTEPPPPIPFSNIQEELERLLNEIDLALNERRKGAWYAFQSGSPDKRGQAAHSMRDILSALISKWASNEDVKKAEWWECEENTRDGVSLRQRLRFLLFGPYNIDGSDSDLEIIEETVSKYFDEDKFLKKVAHGSKEGTDDLIESIMYSIESALLNIIKMRKKYWK